MFIVPISELQPIVTASETEKVKKSSSNFDNVLKNAINELENVQTASDKDSIDLALGRSDDLHGIQINTMKATAAIELTTAVTSKVLNAYKEIINMQM